MLSLDPHPDRDALCQVLSSAALPLVHDHVGPAGIEGRLRVDTASEHPALRLSPGVFREPHAVLLGMSPGNGYFTKKRVEIAVAGFARLSGNVAVIVPDAVSIHTYRALGYGEGDCRAKVKKHGQHLKNRVRRAIERSALEVPDARVRQLDWNGDVATIPGFGAARAQLDRLLETNAHFRRDVLRTARAVIEAKLDGVTSAPDAAVREAANYLLSELAFVRVCPELLGARVIVPYHKPFMLGVNFCAGVYDAPVPGVTWCVYDVECTAVTELTLRDAPPGGEREACDSRGVGESHVQ